jgi:hypothetical protein
MSTLEMGLFYLLIGVGCAGAVLLQAHAAHDRPPMTDACLLLAFWPLYGPFRLLALRPATVARDRSSLPSLEARVLAARERLGEMDRLLALPELSEPSAIARQRELDSAGDARAAETAAARLANIRRLQTMRARFSGEVNAAEELLKQLRVQAEIVRLAGSSSSSAGDLFIELKSRVEGLDAILAESEV